MFISGVTFVRNAVKFDYPVDASVRSLLPLVDELVICLGQSEDGTEALLRNLADPKIKIVHSVWDDRLREGGKVLAVETNKALDAVDPRSDWCIYLQADEVIHEEDYPAIRRALQEFLPDRRVDGLLFNYVHFYGSYHYYGSSRKWYRREIRIVRHDPSIRSFRDAQGFRKNGRLLRVKLIDARIFHYGWVKNPLHQAEKQKHFHRLWHTDEKVKLMVKDLPYDYSSIDALDRYEGTHPRVMAERIAGMNWEFDFDTRIRQLKWKDRWLMRIEKVTGKRLFEYRNYRLLS